MGHKHTREQLLAGALQVALDDGLSQLTYGRVAKALDISDRTVVYYFPTKNDLITAVLMDIGVQLQERLAVAFATKVDDYVALARAAWPVLSATDAQPVFALFFEAHGLAVARREPYVAVIPALVEGWIEWAADFVDGSDTHRRTESEAAVALIDGLLVLNQSAGPEAATRAATRLGIL